MMICKLRIVAIACILASLMGSTESRVAHSHKQRNTLSLAQIQGKIQDGWDDSFVSEQLIDKDNSQAKEREIKEDEDKNSPENIEKSFAQTVLN